MILWGCCVCDSPFSEQKCAMNSFENIYPDRKLYGRKEYDYSSKGSYFITICTVGKEYLLSEIIESKWGNGVCLSRVGKETVYALEYINQLYDELEINEYVIMPNHIHILITIYSDNAVSLKKTIHIIKLFTSRKYGKRLWQSSFFNRMIINEDDFSEKRKYIKNNPSTWETDVYY